MVRKERGIMRKKPRLPSGIVRKIAGVKRDWYASHNGQDIKDLWRLRFSEFHSRVHLMVFQLVFQ
jgi:hypothetical protein